MPPAIAALVPDRLLRALAPAGRSLRARLVVLLLAVGLVPTLALGVMGLRAIFRLTAAETTFATAALQAREQARLQVAAEGAAAAIGTEFTPAEQQAYVLAMQAKYIFSHPELFPAEQQGNTPFIPLADGDLVNRDPTVGVYVPAAQAGNAVLWHDVELLSHMDPLLRSVVAVQGLPSVVRFWVMTPDGLVRADPNPGFQQSVHLRFPGQRMRYYAGRPPGALPATDWTSWTLPYTDPAAAYSTDRPAPEIVSPTVPIYDNAGVFHGLAGADVSLAALQVALQAQLQPPFTSAVLYRPTTDADVAGGPAAEYPSASAGAKLLTVLLAATPGAPAPADFGTPSGSAGTVQVGGGARRSFVAFAPVRLGGWMVAEGAPASAVAAQAATLRRNAATLEWRAVGLLVAVAVALAVGLVLLARRAAGTVTQPLRRLAGLMRSLGAAAADHAPGPPAAAAEGRDLDEVSVLSGEFAALSARLDAATLRWRHEVQERARAELAVLQERNRLAREVHDTLAQDFLSVGLLVDAAQAGESPEQVRRRLAQIAEVARQGLRQARSSLAELAPQPGDAGERPFVQVVRDEAAAFAAALAEPMTVTVTASGWPELPLPVQVALLGVLRSALGNVREHARARHAHIRLAAEPGRAVLSIEDDGVGFDAASDPLDKPPALPDRGRGLPAMRERMAEVGGSLSLRSAPGRGTTVQATVPTTATPGGGAAPQGANPVTQEGPAGADTLPRPATESEPPCAAAPPSAS